MRTGNFNHTVGCRRTLCVRRAPIIAICLLFVLFAGFLSSCGGKGSGAAGAGNYITTVNRVRAFGIEISPDGSKIYLANNVRGELIEMNASTLRSATTYMLDQIPRSLKYVPDEDWLMISFEKYICMEGGDADCMKFAALDISEGQVDIEALKYEGIAGSPNTFAFAASKTVYIANGECRQDVEAGKTDLGALYEADFSGPTGATVPINLVSAASYKAYFGTALSADESALYVSRGCCTYVCTTGELDACTSEAECSADCDEKYYLASQVGEKLDCKESCYFHPPQCTRDTTNACPTPDYEHTCPKKCDGKYAGDCYSWENRILYFDTATLTEDAGSPIELTENCNGAGFMVLDETRNRLYVSCRSAGNISIVDLSADPPSISTVSVGGTLGDVALSAGDDYLFVSNRDNDTVSMIDLDSDTVTKTFSTADYPAGIVEHYPYIYVTNVLSGSVSKIDYTAASTYVAPRAVAEPAPAAGNPVTNSFHSALGH
ncbi:MAG: YncE family protein [bacterium]